MSLSTIKLSKLQELEHLAERNGKGSVSIKTSELKQLVNAALDAVELRIALTKARKLLERSADPFDNACNILLEAAASSEERRLDQKEKKHTSQRIYCDL